jgi:signal transduction histidine kinase
MKPVTNSSKQNLTGIKDSDELILAIKKFAFQNKASEKRASQLIIANNELKKADEEHQREYVCWLEEMMFMTSHRVRQPIARIIGVSTLLESENNSREELIRMTGYMKQSAEALDTLTRELATFIHDKEMKVINKSWA